jgi:membrane-associated phospholipid phosphatase
MSKFYKGLLILLITQLAMIGSSISQISIASTEPTGGNWSTIVLEGDVMRLEPPPPLGSPQEAREIEEIWDLQLKRTPKMMEVAKTWDEGGVIGWNEIARDLVAKHKTDPPMASRIYALLSVAQYDALVEAWNNKYYYYRPTPSQTDGKIYSMVSSKEPSYPSEHAVIAAASAEVLKYVYPDEADFLEDKAREHQESRIQAGANFRSDITAGDNLGRDVARKVIDRAEADGSDKEWNGILSRGSGYWNGTDPVRPNWGSVEPWLASDISQLRPSPPPSIDSQEFKDALKEVKDVSDNRNAHQLAIAQFWADGAGTYTPPGHWNEIACEIIKDHGQSEIRAARTLALMNMAMMDAGICCWDTKYYYCLLRPWEADPEITTPIGRPNFPSYTSGHSAFSAAAAEVLSYVFPDEEGRIRSMAEEAGMSRLYGGIHYIFDIEEGQKGGSYIGKMAVLRGRSDGCPPQTPT